MNPSQIKMMIRLWSRQGLLQGDLNYVQQYSLAWLMAEEREDHVSSLKLGVLASNPEVYKSLFEKPGLDQEDDTPWITPHDESEAEEIMAQIDQWVAEKETFSV